MRPTARSGSATSCASTLAPGTPYGLSVGTSASASNCFPGSGSSKKGMVATPPRRSTDAPVAPRSAVCRSRRIPSASRRRETTSLAAGRPSAALITDTPASP
ncbi:MAG: hypothetical protein A2V77_02585 [Anaeromyxobacter sp. RBG_16_69_14]|nr:MAG: hypothetical protein A2V77_02585 [Anaeromyxobacter sp. RBG_16_69_14]